MELGERKKGKGNDQAAVILHTIYNVLPGTFLATLLKIRWV
jgi:hypothetical protein